LLIKQKSGNFYSIVIFAILLSLHHPEMLQTIQIKQKPQFLQPKVQPATAYIDKSVAKVFCAFSALKHETNCTSIDQQYFGSWKRSSARKTAAQVSIYRLLVYRQDSETWLAIFKSFLLLTSGKLFRSIMALSIFVIFKAEQPGNFNF
jgi:hypothetical protein